MKITVELYGEKVTYESDNDNVTASELIRIFAGLMVAQSFQPETVKDAIVELSEEIEDKPKVYFEGDDFIHDINNEPIISNVSNEDFEYKKGCDCEACEFLRQNEEEHGHDPFDEETKGDLPL